MTWGAFNLRPLTPIPSVPKDAQRNLMTDDALEDIWVAIAMRPQMKVRVWRTASFQSSEHEMA